MAQPVAYVYYVINAESRHPSAFARLRSDKLSELGSVERDMVAGPIRVETSAEDPIEGCEWIFVGMNQGSVNDFPELRGLRSMSVGDAVYFTLNGQSCGTFYCRPQGWLAAPNHVPSKVENLYR